MNRQEFTSRLGFLNAGEETIGLSMYIILKDGTVRFANLKESVREELLANFLRNIDTRLASDNLTYCNLSDYADTRNTICYYDLQEALPGLQPLNAVSTVEEQQEFSFKDDDFSEIEGFVFLIGNETNKVALFKKHYSVSVIKRDASFVPLMKSDTGLVKLDGDVLKINDTFEFMQVDDKVFVFSIKSLESSFGYTGILMRAAKTKFELIQDAELVENIEELEELVKEKKYAKKVVRIKADTPVLSLPFDKVKMFIQNHPNLKKRIKFNDGGDKIKFHSKTSKELFLKLLSDDYLKSELTELLYDSGQKEQLTLEEVE
jgi:hypothetical protein